MFDFLMISTRVTQRGIIEIYPKFIIKKNCSDLMIRGSDFYAVWLEDKGLWSTDEHDALQRIDEEIDKFVAEKYGDVKRNSSIIVKHMWDAESGMIDIWHKYCQKQLRDTFHVLDQKILFSNDGTNKKDYASKRLTYPIEEGPIDAWDQLISTLYEPEEREKIEWSIGSIVQGDSKKNQKFMVLYGASGTGKSTILNVVQQLFEGYYSVFDAKALGSATNVFALESFKSNPLVAIQHDGDLSKIEDNTRLNSLVSHELMTVNEKYKSTYSNSFSTFLFMGTNKPVKITDAKSGLLRRLIDVSPSGNKLRPSVYNDLCKKVKFELGGIAYHCREVYLSNPGRYDNYIPTSMLGASNDFYNFIDESYFFFRESDGVSLKTAWSMYQTYCEDARVPYPLTQRTFKEELKNYFKEFKERCTLDDGSRIRNYYRGFKFEIFSYEEPPKKEEEKEKKTDSWIKLKEQKSLLDEIYKEFPAQYATSNETPRKKWSEVTTTLKDINTNEIHYLKPPESHIVIDFDIQDENGKKCLDKNIEAASKWPQTYAECSKSGNGLHLHYNYQGDINDLSRIYDSNIEIKVFTGKSSLRRKLTMCNDIPVASINSGLPLKGEIKMVNFKAIQSEKGLRVAIKRNLKKEIHGATKPSVDFIYKILEDAYDNGLHYDVTDMRPAIIAFAANSTHQSEYCLSLVTKMHFRSEDYSTYVENNDAPIIFFDVEIFPNLFIVNYKIQGPDKKTVHLINPTPSDIEKLIRYRLIGFNNLRYDNHMLYARLMGYTNEELFRLSQRIIGKSRNCFFNEATNLSYSDIYDFASAGNKKSLKKWEIELGIHHQELGLPWDKPVPKEKWDMVADYCDNDVYATEALFDHLSADWIARQILADLADGNVNNTTNELTTKILFGNNRKPQSQFNYRDLSKPVFELDKETLDFLKDAAPEMMAKRHGPEGSLLPYFPGYTFAYGKSEYRGEDPKEGGYVYAEPGIYRDVALLDIASMHPHSTIMEVLFGVKFTKRFKELVDGRVDIKHEEWDELNNLLDGKLTKYVQKVKSGEFTSKQLANALKTAINSVYGLTSAKFDNPMRDSRNIDNIVAKRGALFMIDLKHAVQEKGFIVAHIKTDSIKIPNATPEIIKFVMDFGKRYGYTFEHEDTYDRMCLVNDAVYIAKNKDGEWTATGTQFQVPYVFKRLFSKEPIVFEDLCETKTVTSALYLDMNEKLEDVSLYEKELTKLKDTQKKKGIDISIRESELNELISKGHDYHFVGKVGNFCPIKPGKGGGILCRYDGIKYNSATGAKGYRWLESEMVKSLHKEDDIDESYYIKLADKAIEAISEYGDFEYFVND